MSTVRQTPDDLLRAVELTHENYIRSLRSYHEALAGRGSFGTPPLRPSINPLSHEISSTSAPTAAPAPARPRRGTNDRLQAPSSLNSFSMAADEAPMPYHDADLMSFIPLLEPMARSNSESGASSASQHAAAAQKTLEQISYSDDSFVSYLKDAEIDDSAHSGTYMALEHVLAQRPDIDGTAELASLLPTIEQDYVTSTCEVYEVDKDSTVNRIEPDLESNHTRIAHGEQTNQIVDSLTVWRTIKNINQSGNSVGRITILQEPTALMLAALRMTMSTHFDMDEIYQHLVTDVDNRGRTRALVATRPFARVPTARPPVAKPPQSEHIRPSLVPGHDADDSLHLRQRSFLFVFKYYTVVAEGLEPAPWQKFDKRPMNRRGADHIDIAECSSVLALSLGGAPVRSVTLKQRRTQGEGLLFDTFAPWHLLSIQAFPDDEHTVREPSATAGATAARKTFCNGPEAFLDALVLEYRDATKRNHILHDRITELITPEILFMFNSALRDKLLFEDKHFTYIRRYFWAYNTLGVINNSIRAMRAGYEQTFTPDFWEGRHTTLWPHPAGPDSAEGRAYRDRLAVLRADLEAAMRDLDRVEKRNEHTRKEIDDLRNQLFSGSSIFESRRAIEQGDFIRILTLGTIIFLPLTFVTSVFGITSYDVPLTDWRFAVMVTCISVPFVILLIVLSSHTGYTQFKNFVHWVKRQLKAVLLATYTWAQQRRGRGRGGKGDTAGVKATPRAAVGRGSASDGERRRPRRKKQLTVKRQDSSTGNRGWYFWREKRVRIEVDMEKKG